MLELTKNIQTILSPKPLPTRQAVHRYAWLETGAGAASSNQRAGIFRTPLNRLLEAAPASKRHWLTPGWRSVAAGGLGASLGDLAHP